MIKIFLILSVSLLFPTVAFAQQLTMGQPPNEDITVTIDENGTAHVVHQVQMNKVKPVQVDMINGNITNFSVTDQNGSAVQYSTLSQSPMAVLIFPAYRNTTLINYDLIHAVSFTNGVWSWNYYEPSDAGYTDFHFPKGIDMVWANERPVYLGDKGLRQEGNGMRLAYISNEPTTVQSVQWQDKTFYVGIRTLAKAGPPVFDQSAMSYAFNIDQPNSFVTVIMPQELLWGPYQTKINTNHTLTNEFHHNSTYAWIGIKPSQSGTVQIVGTTAIPEFPMFVPLVIAISAVVALRFVNKINFH
jgi:hypothetical protein